MRESGVVGEGSGILGLRLWYILVSGQNPPQLGFTVEAGSSSSYAIVGSFNVSTSFFIFAALLYWSY